VELSESVGRSWKGYAVSARREALERKFLSRIRQSIHCRSINYDLFTDNMFN
jgi:hypothetical protein